MKFFSVSNTEDFYAGLKTAVPVTVTFTLIFFAIGGLGTQAGLTFWQNIAFTALVYAGPAQFGVMELLREGAWMAAIPLIALLNLRFALMSGALKQHWNDIPRRELLPKLQFLAASSFTTTFLYIKEKPRKPTQSMDFYIGFTVISFPVAIIGTAMGAASTNTMSTDLMAHVMPIVSMALPLYFMLLVLKVRSNNNVFRTTLAGFIITPIAVALFGVWGPIIAAAGIGLLLTRIMKNREP